MNLKELEQENLTKSEKISNLENVISDLENVISDLEDKNLDYENDISEYQDDISNLDNEIWDYKNKDKDKDNTLYDELKITLLKKVFETYSYEELQKTFKFEADKRIKE
jgi:chromosome segregation ATPase